MGQRVDAAICRGGKFYDRYELRAGARRKCSGARHETAAAPYGSKGP